MNSSNYEALEMSYSVQNNNSFTNINISDSTLQPILAETNLINAAPLSALPGVIQNNTNRQAQSNGSNSSFNNLKIPLSFPDKFFSISPESSKFGSVKKTFPELDEKEKNEPKKASKLFIKKYDWFRKEEEAKDRPKRKTKTLEIVNRFIMNLKIALKRRIRSRLKMYHYQILDENLFDQKDFKDKHNSNITKDQPFFKVYKENPWIKVLQTTMKKIHKFVHEKIPIFSPDHKLLHYWEFFMLFFLIINIANIPLVISFELSEDDYFSLFWMLLEDIPVWIFFVDILITLNTSYYHKGVFIVSRRLILKKYLKNNITLDLLTIIPFFLAKIIKLSFVDVLFLLRVFRLKRLFKNFNEYLELPKPYNSLFDLIKLCFYVVYTAHVLGCIWHYIGMLEINNGVEKTWLHTSNIATEDWKTRYITSLYWSITTMITVGYGDIVPVTPFERLVAIFLMVISSGFFAYSLNSIGSIVQELYHDERTSFKSKFLNSRNVSKKLQVKVKRYLEYMNEEQQDIEARNGLFSRLSDSLKQEILFEMYKDMVKELPLFKANFSKEFLASLIPKIKELTLAPDEIVFQQQDHEDLDIYFVIKGEVELCLLREDSEKQPVRLKTIIKNQSFGEYSFLTGNPREISARCTQVTILGYISQSEFLNIAKSHYAFDFERYYEIRDKINLLKEFSQIKNVCVSCSKDTHDLTHCDILRYIPKRERVMRNHKEDEQNFKKSFSRRRKKTWNARLSKTKAEIAAANIRENLEINELYSYPSEPEEELSKTQLGGGYLKQKPEIESRENLFPAENASLDRKLIRKLTSFNEKDKNRKSRKLTILPQTAKHKSNIFLTPTTEDQEITSPFKLKNQKFHNLNDTHQENETSFNNFLETNDVLTPAHSNELQVSQEFLVHNRKHASIKKKDSLDNFDAMRIYQNFFPHNNYDVIIKLINMKLPDVQVKSKQNFNSKKKSSKQKIIKKTSIL